MADFELGLLDWYDFVYDELIFFCVGVALFLFGMLVMRGLVGREELVLGETPEGDLLILAMNGTARYVKWLNYYRIILPGNASRGIGMCYWEL